jgi:hypothetical protein
MFKTFNCVYFVLTASPDCNIWTTELPRRRRKAWERLESEIPPMPSEAPDADKIYPPKSSLILKPHPDYLHLFTYESLPTMSRVTIHHRLKPLANHVAERYKCTFEGSREAKPAIALFFDPLFVPSNCLQWVWKNDPPTGKPSKDDVYVPGTGDDISHALDTSEEKRKSGESEWKKHFDQTPALVCSLKEDLANRGKPRPTIQTRAQYCQEFFSKEIQVYSNLINEQGYLISKCYGAFIVNFNTREHEDDRMVSVLILEYIGGWTLGKDEKMLSALSEEQKSFISKQVRRIHELLKSVRLVWTNMEPDNFMIVNNDDDVHRLRVVAFEFMATYSCLNLSPEISLGKIIKRNIVYSHSWLKRLGLMDVEISCIE